MNILLLGANGQVGWELQRSLAPLGRVQAWGRTDADLADLAQVDRLAARVLALRPALIVNAAAWTAVDRAEVEEDAATRINALAPQALAAAARQCGSLLLHYSTDYVFDGSGGRPWREADACAPLSAYGRSKLAGEQHILASGCRHLILRTSWVHGAHGGNFVRTMLRLAQARDVLRVVDDQWGAPTSAALIADVSAHAVRHLLRAPEHPGGLYHLAASGCTHWQAFAAFIIEQARQLAPERGWKVRQVEAISTGQFAREARQNAGPLAPRPHNSRLDCTRLQKTFGLHLPPWQDGAGRVVREILAPR